MTVQPRKQAELWPRGMRRVMATPKKAFFLPENYENFLLPQHMVPSSPRGLPGRAWVPFQSIAHSPGVGLWLCGRGTGRAPWPPRAHGAGRRAGRERTGAVMEVMEAR